MASRYVDATNKAKEMEEKLDLAETSCHDEASNAAKLKRRLYPTMITHFQAKGQGKAKAKKGPSRPSLKLTHFLTRFLVFYLFSNFIDKYGSIILSFKFLMFLQVFLDIQKP